MTAKPKLTFQNIADRIDEQIESNSKICKSDSEMVHLWDGGSWYGIPLARCDTHRTMVAWIVQLSRKPWTTTKQIDLFISHVFCRLPNLNTSL